MMSICLIFALGFARNATEDEPYIPIQNESLRVNTSLPGRIVDEVVLPRETQPVIPTETHLNLVVELPQCRALGARYLFPSFPVCFDAEKKALAAEHIHEIDWPVDSCHFLENFYHKRDAGPSQPLSVGPIPSPPAPPLPHKSPDGVPELVQIPCKPCDQDRKDRQFVRGVPFSASMTKLLVDYASAPSGGKILASSPGMRGANEVLNTDDNRYLLTPCANKVWLTIRLSDEIFLEKIGIISNELFASTFRHIQILGSRQYPTNEWRVLGEIETNPVETHEWFDLSGSSQCSKCYVKYLKIRVLTHHALEGYTNCALTRIQVFGSTVLQSLDRIQSMNSSMSETSSSQMPGFVKLGARGSVLIDSRFRAITGQEVPSEDIPGESSTSQPPMPQPPPTPVEEGSNPLLNLIDEMSQLKKQYSTVLSSVYTLNENLKSQAQIVSTVQDEGRNTTTFSSVDGSNGGVKISFLGIGFSVPKLVFPDITTVVLIVVSISQIVIIGVLLRGQTAPAPPPNNIVVSLHQEDQVTSAARRFSIRNLPPQSVQFKKRSHGLWRPKARRHLYFAMLKKSPSERSSSSSSPPPQLDLVK